MRNRTKEQRAKVEARITRPPRGYEGDLSGTPWDHDAMLADFDRAAADFDQLGG